MKAEVRRVGKSCRRTRLYFEFGVALRDGKAYHERHNPARYSILAVRGLYWRLVNEFVKDA